VHPPTLVGGCREASGEQVPFFESEAGHALELFEDASPFFFHVVKLARPLRKVEMEPALLGFPHPGIRLPPRGIGFRVEL
jgi:hypothetical protein